MKRYVLVLVFLFVVLVLSGVDQGPAIAQDQDLPTTRGEIIALNPQITVVGNPEESVETYPDLDDLAKEGSMMALVDWPTICMTDGTEEWEQVILLAVSCGEQATYATQFIGACSANPSDALGTMAGMVTQPGQLPVESFTCFPIPPD